MRENWELRRVEDWLKAASSLGKQNHNRISKSTPPAPVPFVPIKASSFLFLFYSILYHTNSNLLSYTHYQMSHQPHGPLYGHLHLPFNRSDFFYHSYY